MFSYRHAFHAGNHADVLKHIVLRQLVAYMLRKEKGFAYVDTHAGAGYYGLTGSAAGSATPRNREADNGIIRLWQAAKKLPAAIADYLASVQLLNDSDSLQYYPGSPFIVAPFIRAQDSMRLCEWHPREIIQLRENFSAATQAKFFSKKAHHHSIYPLACKPYIVHEDGFKHMRAALPPLTRRGLIMIDPSYENKNDYAATRSALSDALTRFPQGIYAIWYPQITRDEAIKFPTQLKRLCSQYSWCHISLSVKQAAPNRANVQRLAENAAQRASRLSYFEHSDDLAKKSLALSNSLTSSKSSSPRLISSPTHTANQKNDSHGGLWGSGLFIVNPPYDLSKILEPALPVLVNYLAQDSYAKYQLEQQIL